MCKVLPQSGILLHNFILVIKFSLLFLNFEVVVGNGLRTGLLSGQLTNAVRTAHFIIRFRNGYFAKWFSVQDSVIHAFGMLLVFRKTLCPGS